VAEENPAPMVDTFVEELDLGGLGFEWHCPSQSWGPGLSSATKQQRFALSAYVSSTWICDLDINRPNAKQYPERRKDPRCANRKQQCLPQLALFNEHELTCACGCRKHVISEETSEQLDIVPMQIRVIKHIRKVYGCRDCETAPVTADKPAQLIEKSMASPSVLAMLLTTKYVDGLPLHRFETVLSRHGIDIPRQTLARWIIQCGEHLQPLLNLMRDRLLESPVIHCDETRVQVLKEPGRDPTSQS
jgi:transposase